MKGEDAVKLIESISDRVMLRKKDNTDKFWCYKLTSGRKTEFAFDPRTKTGLFVRVDLEPPNIRGVTGIESITGKDVSTALGRVFSGGLHKARYKAEIEDSDALLGFIEYYESL